MSSFRTTEQRKGWHTVEQTARPACACPMGQDIAKQGNPAQPPL